MAEIGDATMNKLLTPWIRLDDIIPHNKDNNISIYTRFPVDCDNYTKYFNGFSITYSPYYARWCVSHIFGENKELLFYGRRKIATKLMKDLDRWFIKQGYEFISEHDFQKLLMLQ